MAEAVGRPAAVAVAAVLVLVAGAIDVISGVLLLLQPDVPEIAATFGAGVAIGSIVVGAILVIAAYGVWRGNSIARMVVTVLEAFSLIGSLFLAVAYLGTAVGEWIGVAFSAVILILLWTKDTSAYFRRAAVAAR
jgi:K+ transporter